MHVGLLSGCNLTGQMTVRNVISYRRWHRLERHGRKERHKNVPRLQYYLFAPCPCICFHCENLDCVAQQLSSQARALGLRGDHGVRSVFIFNQISTLKLDVKKNHSRSVGYLEFGESKPWPPCWCQVAQT